MKKEMADSGKAREESSSRQRYRYGEGGKGPGMECPRAEPSSRKSQSQKIKLTSIVT